MSVIVTWSLTNGGASISSDLSHGDVSNGSTSTEKEIFIRHNGSNPITNCGLYMTKISGTYPGSATPEDDYNEIIGWGDGNTASTFGGLQVNMDAVNGYPSLFWPIYSYKSPIVTTWPSGEVTILGFACRTGVGDSPANSVELPPGAGCCAPGQIQAGSAPNVRFKIRFKIPSSESVTGVRACALALSYDYTS